MNTRIIKETRSLLPVFCVTALACAAPRLIWSREIAGGIGLGIFTICCLILGASCFGNEYQWRTMPLLLAQPVPRQRIWNEKMLVLGTALGLGLILFLLCVPVADADTYLFLFVFPFCVLCTAPHMALNIKNTLMAAVCTFGLPFGLCGTLALLAWVFSRFFPATGLLLEDSIENHSVPWVCTAAAIYCAVYYRLGYQSFMKLEAVDSQTRELALPPRIEAMLARPLARLLPRYSGPWASLIRKELQLQKPSFLLAGALCVASPLAALAWHLHHSEAFVGLAAAAIAVLVFVIPFITSGICVAEERNWGVSGWQLALPVSARKQWAAKMLTVVFTSVLLGIVVPLLLWVSDGWVFRLPIGPGPLHFGGPWTPPSLEQIVWAFLVVLDFSLGYLFVLGLGAFTSSTCANSAKAIIMNIGLMIASGCLVGGIISGIVPHLEIHYYQIERAPAPLGFAEENIQEMWTVFGVVLALLLSLVQYFAYANYRNGEPSSRRVWRQLATVTGAIVAGALVYWALLYWNMVGRLFSNR
jgi:ABC-type transport system involved in multi-copper enzyme maturation permease subunit